MRREELVRYPKVLECVLKIIRKSEFRKAKSFGNAVRVNSELTPFAKMAKAEESFTNWEQNWRARDKLELRRPEPGGVAETRQ